jgi:hypothetical protein
VTLEQDYEARVAGVQRSLELRAASRSRSRDRKAQSLQRRAEVRAVRALAAGALL